MLDSCSFPGDLAECHRQMAQLQACLAEQAQRINEQAQRISEQEQRISEQQQQAAEQAQQYRDLDQVLSRTTEDFSRLQEEHRNSLELLHQLQRWAFGSRRERHVADPRQRHLFDMASLLPDARTDAAAGTTPEATTTPAEDAAASLAAQQRAARRRSQRAARKLCLDALPQIEHHHDVAEDEKVCDACGREKTCIGEDVSRLLDFVPASLEVHNHHLKKYACTCGQCGVTTAAAPVKPIEKCIAGPGLLSSLIVSKCSDHVPLYRSEDILVRHGLHIPRSTLCDWVHGGSMLLLPLVAFMMMRVLQQPVLWTDDTPVMFFDRNGRLVTTRRRQSSLRRGRFWPYIARGDAPYSVFEFTVSRRRDGPATVLSGWSGFLQADAYSGYDSVIHDSQGRIIEVACWAHARRKFFEALETDRRACGLMLEWIGQLYDIEDRALLLSDAERLRLRQAESLPILSRMGQWLNVDAGRMLPDGVLPKSSAGKAIRYVLNHWSALQVYTTDGRLTIDNNLSERTVRLLALGRSNWLFLGSEDAGYRMAVLFTIVANAKRHHLDPFAYVRDLLLRMSTLYADSGVKVPDFTQVSSAEFRGLGMSLATQLSSEALTAMLPDHWATAHPEHVLVHRIAEARQVADRKRDRREQRRGIHVVPPTASK